MSRLSVCTALLAVVSPLGGAVRAQVLLPPGEPEGVRWAAATAEAQLPGVRVRCREVADGALGAEGFRLRGERGEVFVEGPTPAGLMYGLLALVRQAETGAQVRALRGQESRPAMWLRAVDLNPAMWLGIWPGSAGLAAHDRSSDWWFHDEAHWRALFRRLAQQRLNAVVLVHPHLFPAFLDYSPAYPEATYLQPDELAAKQLALRTALRLGKQYNVTFHWLRWNIWLPPGFAQAHGLAQEGVDSELTRRLETWCVAEFYRTFPEFGSIISQCGESPPGCTDFIREGTIPGLRQVSPRPRHIIWPWCANPPEVVQMVQAYEGPTALLHYLQNEQLFTDRADPRIGWFHEAVGGADMIALGGPKGAHTYLYWGSPEWSRGLMRTLHAEGGRGVVIECTTESPDRWLAQEALARYAWDPRAGPEPGYWRAALAARYGSPRVAEPLRRAMEAASRILGRQLMLTHSQSGAFHPQLGLSLLQCLEMPSVTDYIFETAQAVDEQGYLTPRMGLCWSGAQCDWGERVVPLRQYALGLVPDSAARAAAMEAWMATRRAGGFAPSLPRPDDTTPPEIAEQLHRLAADAEGARGEVEACLPVARHADELARIVRLLRVNTALGRYFAALDRAAVGWEVYHVTGDPAALAALPGQLDASVQAWRTYAGLQRELWGDHLWAYRSTVAHPAPWSQADFWAGYVNQAWDLGELTRLAEREAEILKERLRTWPREGLEPPTFDELRTIPPDATVTYEFGFEDAAPRGYRLLTHDAVGGHLTRDPALVISGQASLVGDSRGAAADWTEFFVTDPAWTALKPGAAYEAVVRYRVLDPGPTYRAPFGMALRTTKGGPAAEQGDARNWGNRGGTVHERMMRAMLGDFDDYFLFLTIRGEAAIVVDDLRLYECPAR